MEILLQQQQLRRQVNNLVRQHSQQGPQNSCRPRNTAAKPKYRNKTLRRTRTKPEKKTTMTMYNKNTQRKIAQRDGTGAGSHKLTSTHPSHHQWQNKNPGPAEGKNTKPRSATILFRVSEKDRRPRKRAPPKLGANHKKKQSHATSGKRQNETRFRVQEI
ncbi:hypothetical protein J6590_061301 [Homalodisca vitripennis]|nr:hypothetical protein J6590_061301 [Homalodisca vitripennis]